MEITVALKAGIALVLKLLNVAIHGIGFYLLRRVQKRSRANVQMVYITNLSVVEFMINVLSFTRNLLKITGLKAFKSREFKILVTYSYIFDYAILKFCLYMTMIALTLDRSFLITLNVMYRNHCNVKRARCIIRITWLVGVLLFIIMSSIHIYHTIYHTSDVRYIVRTNKTIADSHNDTSYLNATTTQHQSESNMFFIANFVTLMFDFIFLSIAVVSYTSIYYVYRRRQRKLQTKKSEREPETKLGLWRTFRKSRFYVSLLLILTFVIFVIPADIVWTVYSLRATNRIVETATTISYAISYLSDGLIYIFTNPKVKRLFVMQLRRIKVLGPMKERVPSSFYETESVRDSSFSRSTINQTSSTPRDISASPNSECVPSEPRHLETTAVSEKYDDVSNGRRQVCTPLIIREDVGRQNNDESELPTMELISGKCPLKLQEEYDLVVCFKSPL